jgi:uncharacterized membrane protein
VPNDDNAFLFASGMFAISTIFMIEDRHYRKSMIARLEALQNEAVPQIATPEASPAVVAARVRKVKIILFSMMCVFLIGPIIALYFTIDMPWWLFLALLAVYLVAVAIGITLARRRQKKELDSHQLNK